MRRCYCLIGAYIENANYTSADLVKPRERVSSRGGVDVGELRKIPVLYSVPLLTNSVSFQKTNTIIGEGISHGLSRAFYGL